MIQNKEEIKDMSLIRKLASIREMSNVVKKEKSGHQHKYADIASLLVNIMSGMNKYRVSLIPKIVPGTGKVMSQVISNTKYDKTGTKLEYTSTEMLVTCDMVFKWINDDNPNEYIDVPWFMTGSQGDPSQAFGSGLTYCTRYFYTNYFQIATPDIDVDEYRRKQKESEAQEENMIVKEILKRFDDDLRIFLTSHPDKKEEIEAFVGRYAKKANYWSITNSTLAAKLLADFRAKYVEESSQKESDK